MKALEIYIVFCLITFLLVEIELYVIRWKIKKKYVHKTVKNQKKAKRYFVAQLFLHIKTFIISFVPVINLSLFLQILFKSKQIEEDALDKADKKLKEFGYYGGN